MRARRGACIRTARARERVCVEPPGSSLESATEAVFLPAPVNGSWLSGKLKLPARDPALRGSSSGYGGRRRAALSGRLHELLDRTGRRVALARRGHAHVDHRSLPT